MKKYKISDVAMLIGTSKEAIRYFEKHGYIQPQREDGESYRHYDDMEAGMLRWLKLYRSYGFSLEEAADLLQQPDVSGQRPLLEKGLAHLDEQIEWLGRVRNDLAGLIEEQAQEKERLQLQTRPALYRLELEVDGRFKFKPKDAELLKPWFDHMPLVKSTPLLFGDAIQAGTYRQSAGLGILEKDIGGWNPSSTPGVRLFPACPCVTALFGPMPRQDHLFDRFHDFAKQNGLALSGDAILRPVALFRPGSNAPCYHRIYIPVVKT